MKNLIARIDQKISFILSALINKPKKEVTNEDLENITIESNYLDEQLEAQKELLDDEIVKFNQDLENDDVEFTTDKILMNLLIRKGIYDDLEKEDFEECLETNRYTSNDIKIFKNRKKDVLKILKNTSCPAVTTKELIDELEDILNG